MPTFIALSGNDMPYSQISFSAIFLLTFGKEGRRLPPWSKTGVTLAFQPTFFWL
jgi:hypothetical protein